MKVILPRYVKYVENDPNILDPDTKEERIRTANKLMGLIEEAWDRADD